jgi:hypothetical protein
MTQALHVKNCEYIHRDTLQIIQHVSILPPPAMQLHMQIIKLHKEGKEIPADLLEHYKTTMKQIAELMPHIVHYSWADLDSKRKRSIFWDSTFHGQQGLGHNTTTDIEDRINNKKELTMKVDLNHPLKGGKINVI